MEEVIDLIRSYPIWEPLTYRQRITAIRFEYEGHIETLLRHVIYALAFPTQPLYRFMSPYYIMCYNTVPELPASFRIPDFQVSSFEFLHFSTLERLRISKSTDFAFIYRVGKATIVVAADRKERKWKFIPR